MVPHYKYGRRKELQVGEFLARHGYDWGRSPGSRGPVDLIAEGNRQRLLIQVKGTRKSYTSYTRLTIDEERSLIRRARANRAQPALALTSGNYVWTVSVPHRQLILKGQLKPLRHDYPSEG